MCEECYETRETHCGGAVTIRVLPLHCGYMCMLCQSYGVKFIETFYEPASIGVMENTIKTLKDKCDQLEARCEVLENHIKYAPGGEGAFKAMCSFYKSVETETLKNEP